MTSSTIGYWTKLLPRAYSFFSWKAGRIKAGGFPVLISSAVELVILGLAILPLLLARLLRPVILIRFARLPTYRIGPLAAYPEVYLSERDTGMYPGRSLDIFFPDSYVSNKQLMKMWKRKLHIWPAARPLGRLNKWLPGSDKHEVPWRTDYAREIDIHGVLAATQVHVGFTDNEEQQGRVQRRAIGIPDGGPFVCFHARDSAYLDALSGTDTGKHDCRDSNIQTYIPAMEELVRRGYSAVRMGSVIKHPLTTMNPKIIDYATKGTTEFFDVYVSANCSFFVCSPTGFSRLPMIFRRPSAFVNFVPFEFVLAWGPNDLCIPKKLWLREEFRFMTLQEIFETGVAKFELSFLFDQRGIDVVENTSEEITALMVEMDERISGRWKTSEEDEDLQKRFRSYFEAYNPTRTYQSRVGAQFLRQNQDLLE